VVVREGGTGGQAQPGGFEANEELLRAGDAAEGSDGAIGDRNFHLAAEPPDRPLPAPGAQLGFQVLLVCRNGDDAGAADGFERLAQIAGREQPVLPVLAVEEQNLDIPRQLPVLKAVIEQMKAYLRG